MNDMSGLSGVEAFSHFSHDESHDESLPEASDHRSDHAVFGRLLIDLGYKKVYASSARSITTNVPIWSLQVRVRKFEEFVNLYTRDAGTHTPGCVCLSLVKG